MEFGEDIKASENEKYEFMIDVAKGDHNIESIKDWIGKKLR